MPESVVVRPGARGEERGLRRWRRTTRRNPVKGVALSLLVGLLLPIGLVPPAGAADATPPDVVETVEFSETGVPSPLRPGLAGQLHFTLGFRAPILGPQGFAAFEVDGAEMTISNYSLDGQASSATVTLEQTIDDFVRPVQVTDGFALGEVLNSTFPPSASTVFRIDRTTGALVATPTSTDTSGAARLSPDGEIITGSFVNPYWARIIDGAITGDGFTFSADDYTSDQLTPTMSADARYVAVTGATQVGDEAAVRLLWVSDTTGAVPETQWPLPCPVDDCEYDLTAIRSGSDGASAFVAAYSLEASFSSTDRVDATYYEIDLLTGVAEPSIPVSVVSPNGRYVAGLAPVGDDGLELDQRNFTVLDLLTGRQREVANNLPDFYELSLLALSDDGRTLRYNSIVPCDGICLARPAYFGSVELLPVADVTRGPAEDEILRLYRAVFGRIPDAGGFEYWINQYREGEPLLDIAAAFAGSDEFVARYGADLTDEDLIDALYQNVLDRSGDAGGVAFWLELRGGGASVAELLVGFANSPENIERTGTREPIAAPVGRVLRIYRAMLGREPDAGGLAFWVGRYNDDLTLAEMAEQFTFQPEFAQLYGENPSNADLVDAVYLNVLGRPGDEGGVAFWLDQLDTGLTVPELFVSFADSPENIEATGTIR